MKKNKYRYAVVLERGEDGFIVAHCPALKGCWSQGKTRAEALRNIREAIELYVETLVAHDEPVPNEDMEMVEVAA
ncbi:MAG: type II toxin-antitoxin system HicB family antitoxin [Chloroflexi bacterium]|nr:type II toxin-antitoxin system HicB family antitoxin [Chloroflexota bacterium]